MRSTSIKTSIDNTITCRIRLKFYLHFNLVRSFLVPHLSLKLYHKAYLHILLFNSKIVNMCRKF